MKGVRATTVEKVFTGHCFLELSRLLAALTIDIDVPLVFRPESHDFRGLCVSQRMPLQSV